MAKILEYARLLTVGPKNPVPKRKRKILKEADKELTRLESQKTARTKAVEEATGVPSDIERQKRAVARRAKSTLMAKGK
ncbi:MAG: hypothetical protein M0Q24_11570 [Sulfurimonas sp.]|jgi:hypothetical protein|uniref:hypothetical protein n=1 Tax=Sulfurimonas sp. TaxID=2022749 RepID=UPI0025D74F80|nr:hypothetical protein [Sulfurimonas sp.]MCK9492710.1 hypothetical protein [Sulfurimonas sp.]